MAFAAGASLEAWSLTLVIAGLLVLLCVVETGGAGPGVVSRRRGKPTCED